MSEESKRELQHSFYVWRLSVNGSIIADFADSDEAKAFLKDHCKAETTAIYPLDICSYQPKQDAKNQSSKG